jgi:polar amino acid transport system permease protein
VTYTFSFGQVSPFIPALLGGFLRTLLLTFAAAGLGMFVAAAIYTLRLIPSGRLASIVEFLARLYIDVWLSLPVLVGLVWLYFAAPLYGLSLDVTSVSVVVLGLSFSAFLLDLVRGAERSLSEDQAFAARIHGMRTTTYVRRIAVPQIFRIIADPATGLLISLLKLSTFASIIGVQEILSVANGVITQTYRPMEVYTIVAVIFLVAIVPLNFVRRVFDASAIRGERLG